ERHATCCVDPLDGSRTPRAPGPGHHLRVLRISRARRRLIYSTLSASDGSTRAARRAGMRLATADTLSRIIAAPAHDTGSAAPIPYSAPATTRAAAIAARHPAARPTTATTNPCFMMRPRTVDGCAPSAIRIPISRVRRATEYAITP